MKAMELADAADYAKLHKSNKKNILPYTEKPFNIRKMLLFMHIIHKLENPQSILFRRCFREV